MSDAKVETFNGSCHCGAVKFEVDLDLGKGGSHCNCSICNKIGQLGVIAKPEAFRLLTSETALSIYEWGAKISQRYFCKTCGVHCFARGFLEQIGGAYVSVNLNAVDGIEPSAIPHAYWDGRHDNWMAGTRPEPWPIRADGAFSRSS